MHQCPHSTCLDTVCYLFFFPPRKCWKGREISTDKHLRRAWSVCPVTKGISYGGGSRANYLRSLIKVQEEKISVRFCWFYTSLLVKCLVLYVFNKLLSERRGKKKEEKKKRERWVWAIRDHSVIAPEVGLSIQSVYCEDTKCGCQLLSLSVKHTHNGWAYICNICEVLTTYDPPPSLNKVITLTYMYWDLQYSSHHAKYFTWILSFFVR